MVRSRAKARTFQARRRLGGRPSSRAKTLIVPKGRRPRRAARKPPGTSAMPSRTSLAVPSPPAAMRVWKPSATAWAARRRASPGAEVARKTHWPRGRPDWNENGGPAALCARVQIRQGVSSDSRKGISDYGFRIRLRSWCRALFCLGSKSVPGSEGGGGGAESDGQLAGNLVYFRHLLRGQTQLPGRGGNPGLAGDAEFGLQKLEMNSGRAAPQEMRALLTVLRTGARRNPLRRVVPGPKARSRAGDGIRLPWTALELGSLSVSA